MAKHYEDIYLDGSLIVTGSFSVYGTASVISTTNLLVQDSLILLASTQSGTPTLDSGFLIRRGTGMTAGFIWDESAGEFSFIKICLDECPQSQCISSYQHMVGL